MPRAASVLCPADYLPWSLAGWTVLGKYASSIDPDAQDADGWQGGVLRRRTVSHGFRVEEYEIGKRARPKHTTVLHPHVLRGEGGHLVNRRFQRQSATPADVPRQDPRERPDGFRRTAVRSNI